MTARPVDIVRTPRCYRRKWYVEAWVGDEMLTRFFRSRRAARRWAATFR